MGWLDVPKLSELIGRHEAELLASPCVSQLVMIDGKTGERRLLPCGSRNRATCPPCAERYRRDEYITATSGLRVLDLDNPEGIKVGVSGADLGFSYYFLTLTLPSYGAVHSRPKARPGVGSYVCKCGEVHNEGSGILGLPIYPDTYDYESHGLANLGVGHLFHRTTDLIKKSLGRKDMAFYGVPEYQRRGVIHPHVILRFESPLTAFEMAEILRLCGEVSAELVGDFTEELELLESKDSLSREESMTLEKLRSYKHLMGYSLSWGSQVDLQEITAENSSEVEKVLGYALKTLAYITKDLRENPNPEVREYADYWSNFEYETRTPAMDLRQTGFTVLPILKNTKVKIGREFGFMGNLRFKSRNWTLNPREEVRELPDGSTEVVKVGLSHAELARRRSAFMAENHGAETVDFDDYEVAGVKVDWVGRDEGLLVAHIRGELARVRVQFGDVPFTDLPSDVQDYLQGLEDFRT